MSLEEQEDNSREWFMQTAEVFMRLEKCHLDMLTLYCDEHRISLSEGFARAIERLVQSEGGRVTALASERTLSRIWITSEEDEAWQYL